MQKETARITREILEKITPQTKDRAKIDDRRLGGKSLPKMNGPGLIAISAQRRGIGSEEG